jgi:hypothetical protein
MAPPAFHFVRKHAKITQNGVKYYVKAHLRKNRGNAAVLLPENILYLYWHGDLDFPKLGQVKGFPEHPEVDSIIHFWLEYWKSLGLKFPNDLTPFHIKVIIAKESSFKVKADPKSKHSSAYGLMQITNWTRDDLIGKSRKNIISIRDHYIDLDRKDLEDPVINIAAGIRWLSYKYSSIPKKAQKNLFNTLKNYYDWNLGDNYANSIINLYNISKSN